VPCVERRSRFRYGDVLGAQTQRELLGPLMKPPTRYHDLDLSALHLEGANLVGVHLERAILSEAHLEGVLLYEAHLQGASLIQTHLAQANLGWVHLEGADLSETDLQGADLSWAFMDRTTVLRRPKLSGAFLSRTHWADADLTEVEWSHLPELGDELYARQRVDILGDMKDPATRLVEYQQAVQANRSLSIALQNQGMNEDADRYAYRARRLQRTVLLRQGHWGSWLFSLVLDGLAGYGYRPGRSVVAYVELICAFAVAYLALGGAGGHSLTWNEGLVISLTAFHGRGFFATAFHPGDPQAALAAGEAVLGLLLEIIFIATFTQRIFGTR
jgi:uncharacterized protein YjbI with pentapeptide repeats